MFGGISMVAGVFSLSFPETLNAKLPDTIEEAIHMGEEHEPHKSVDWSSYVTLEVYSSHLFII